jgi:hypothetical protein
MTQITTKLLTQMESHVSHKVYATIRRQTNISSLAPNRIKIILLHWNIPLSIYKSFINVTHNTCKILKTRLCFGPNKASAGGICHSCLTCHQETTSLIYIAPYPWAPMLSLTIIRICPLPMFYTRQPTEGVSRGRWLVDEGSLDLEVDGKRENTSTNLYRFRCHSIFIRNILSAVLYIIPCVWMLFGLSRCRPRYLYPLYIYLVGGLLVGYMYEFY